MDRMGQGNGCGLILNIGAPRVKMGVTKSTRWQSEIDYLFFLLHAAPARPEARRGLEGGLNNRSNRNPFVQSM